MESNTVGGKSRQRAWRTASFVAALLAGWGYPGSPAQSSTDPLLSIRPWTPNQVQVAWTNSAVGFSLERADALSRQPQWRSVGQSPAELGNQFLITLPAIAAKSFFRLSEARLTTIANTSPFSGEQGVAVTRETIVWFSAPLATNAVLNLNNFHADVGGRRILSRVELSSDRSKATLFYLEPLPANTRISVVMDGTGLTDALGRAVDLDGDGQTGGQAIISFETLNVTAVVGTAVMGRVFASELIPGSDTGTNAANRPLEGVTITVDGMEETLRAKTDAQGNFLLDPAPPGRFFVKIDGRTARGSSWPNGQYYPSVGKQWTAVAGRKDNLAGGTGEIFLPLIKQGTLQTVSQVQDTAITFPPAVLASNPALTGVSVTVPANSLFSDDGVRGGKVGIAPVPPDRLPGPLPPGLELALVITVQTDGPLNFDKPAPICFPNLPDPLTQAPLPAGSKQALISFNHKKGLWEAVGGMTVSADGRFICTDPGVGILQPGWHGVGPTPAAPPPPPGPPCGGAAPSSLQGAERPYALSKTGGQACTPPLPPCGYDIDALGEGFKECDRRKARCLDDGHRAYLKRRKACLKEKNAVLQRQCNLNNVDQGEKDIQECNGNDIYCRRRVVKCWATPAPSSLRTAKLSVDLSATGPSVRDQVFAVLDEALALVQPYGVSGTDIPAAVQAQVDALIAQADQLVGGDAEAFLEADAIQLETALASVAESFPLTLADVPAYPVLYAAEILRPSGLLYLRGETGPYGQYSLFVPRDGVLLSVSFYDPRSNGFARIYPNLDPQAEYRLPAFVLTALSATAPDADNDGLPDEVEGVYGTNPRVADSDGDGIPDGAEVANGTDPLDGLPARTGMIALTQVPGAALDLCVLNEVAIVGGTRGLFTLGLAESSAPTLLGQVATTGSVRRVSCSGNFVAAAQGPAGLAFIDITDLNKPALIHQLGVGDVRAVVTAGRRAYAGLNNGVIIQLDMPSGLELDRVTITNAVSDLAMDGDYLYALDATRLHVLRPINGHLTWIGSALSPFTAAPNVKLSLGGGLGYAVHARGYNTFDLTNPAQPVLIQAGNTAQVGWKQIVPNGSGLGLAVVGPNSGDATPHDLALYDVSDPKKTDVYLTTFTMPGVAQAVALYNGKAYVAADSAGLVVVNYLPYDSQGIAPTVSLALDFPVSGVEEGTLARVVARATDDVQVRAVEFYLDGVKAFSAGQFPFEYRFVTPFLTEGKTTFRLRAKAIDTGGNSAWTDEVTISLLPDKTPPAIIGIDPANRSVLSALSVITLFFSEPVQLSTLGGATVQVLYAGPDHKFGTADDQLIGGGVLKSRPETDAVSITFPTDLPIGQFQLTASTAIKDAQGVAMARDYGSIFWILPGGADGDADDDELSNGDEMRYGTNPVVADSDGDGWLDGVEVENGSDPLDPKSRPRTTYMAQPPVIVALQSADDGVTPGITLARPPTLVHLNNALDDGLNQRGLTLAQPPTIIHLESAADESLIQPGLTLARPPLSIKFPQQ